MQEQLQERRGRRKTKANTEQLATRTCEACKRTPKSIGRAQRRVASLLAVERRKLRKNTGDAKVERTENGEGKDR